MSKTGSHARQFEVIEHTADIGVIAYGENLAAAYANAALGLFDIICDTDKVREVESRTVEIHSADEQGLLFDWLNHLIYIFEVERMLFRRFDVTDFDGKSLHALCHGEKYDTSRHELRLGVKSATYHMMSVDKDKNTVRVIFDV